MIKKKKKSEEHENLERWLLTYADMITLLMVFFIMMYAISMLDMKKFDKAKEGFHEAFGGANISSILPGGKSVFGGGADPYSTDSVVVFEKFVNSKEEKKENAAEKQALQSDEEKIDLKKVDIKQALTYEWVDRELVYIAENIIKNIKGTIHDQDVNLLLEKRGLVIRIQSEGIFFDSGSAQLKNEILPLLDIIAKSIKYYTGMLIIEGHSDNVPISTIIYPSNWEISTARAASVLRYWVNNNMVSLQNVMIAGYADTRPIAPNDTAENRTKNRRVEILVLNKEDTEIMSK